MTKERFNELLSCATVRLSTLGLVVSGVTQEEMAELVTLAGERLGAWDDGRQVNPEYLELGLESN